MVVANIQHGEHALDTIETSTAYGDTNSCIDNPDYENRYGFSCSHHEYLNCQGFAALGFRKREVDDLLKNCPSACRVNGCGDGSDDSDGSTFVNYQTASPLVQAVAAAAKSESSESEADAERVLGEDTLDDMVCFPGWDPTCADDITFRSRLKSSCEAHTQFDCRATYLIGFNEQEVAELINRCPCSCGIECGTWTMQPTTSPTSAPTSTDVPTSNPTSQPTSAEPTHVPSAIPTSRPSQHPTTSAPTPSTPRPTVTPTFVPTHVPTVPPTTASPSSVPTTSPTTSAPSRNPTPLPSNSPTHAPTSGPTITSSAPPSATHSSSPSAEPTATASFMPSSAPSVTHSAAPSISASPTTTPSTSLSPSISARPTTEFAMRANINGATKPHNGSEGGGLQLSLIIAIGAGIVAVFIVGIGIVLRKRSVSSQYNDDGENDDNFHDNVKNQGVHVYGMKTQGEPYIAPDGVIYSRHEASSSTHKKKKKLLNVKTSSSDSKNRKVAIIPLKNSRDGTDMEVRRLNTDSLCTDSRGFSTSESSGMYSSMRESIKEPIAKLTIMNGLRRGKKKAPAPRQQQQQSQLGHNRTHSKAPHGLDQSGRASQIKEAPPIAPVTPRRDNRHPFGNSVPMKAPNNVFEDDSYFDHGSRPSSDAVGPIRAGRYPQQNDTSQQNDILRVQVGLKSSRGRSRSRSRSRSRGLEAKRSASRHSRSRSADTRRTRSQQRRSRSRSLDTRQSRCPAQTDGRYSQEQQSQQQQRHQRGRSRSRTQSEASGIPQIAPISPRGNSQEQPMHFPPSPELSRPIVNEEPCEPLVDLPFSPIETRSGRSSKSGSRSRHVTPKSNAQNPFTFVGAEQHEQTDDEFEMGQFDKPAYDIPSSIVSRSPKSSTNGRRASRGAFIIDASKSEDESAVGGCSAVSGGALFTDESYYGLDDDQSTTSDGISAISSRSIRSRIWAQMAADMIAKAGNVLTPMPPVQE